MIIITRDVKRSNENYGNDSVTISITVDEGKAGDAARTLESIAQAFEEMKAFEREAGKESRTYKAAAKEYFLLFEDLNKLRSS